MYAVSHRMLEKRRHNRQHCRSYSYMLSCLSETYLEPDQKTRLVVSPPELY